MVINIESSSERALSVNPEIPAAPYAGIAPCPPKSLSFSVEDVQQTHSESVLFAVFFPIISYASALFRDSMRHNTREIKGRADKFSAVIRTLDISSHWTFCFEDSLRSEQCRVEY